MRSVKTAKKLPTLQEWPNQWLDRPGILYGSEEARGHEMCEKDICRLARRMKLYTDVRLVISPTDFQRTDLETMPFSCYQHH